MQRYFNYRFTVVESAWQRREFSRRWCQIYGSDPRWVPPRWTHWRRVLGQMPPHLARMGPTLIMGEALPQRPRPRSPQRNDVLTFSSAMFEESVAAGVLLRDPRRRDRAAYVAHLHVVNDTETLTRFLARAQEVLEPTGVRSLILPTGLSPHLQTGVLQDHFHQLPPHYTPYNPPYVPEVVAAVCRPLGRSQLYVAGVAPPPAQSTAGGVQLRPLDPMRLASDLLPLLQATVPLWADFPPPDAAEAAFLLDWARAWPLTGWLAEVEERAVGFVLLQADVAPALHRSGGGRNPLWRAWLHWRAQRPFAAGRLLWGGVLPENRRQGIGTRLWRQALHTAHTLGWRTLSIGPLPTTADANQFLQAQGVEPTRSYLLHRVDF